MSEPMPTPPAGGRERVAPMDAGQVEVFREAHLRLSATHGDFCPPCVLLATLDSTRAELERAEGERDEWKKSHDRTRAELNAHRAKNAGSVWYWQDDECDDPESLACPVLMEPEVVRRFVAAESRAAELAGLVKEVLDRDPTAECLNGPGCDCFTRRAEEALKETRP